MINCAVIGVGNMGRHHARNLYHIPEAQLVAISDLNPHIGKPIAKTYHCSFYQNHHQLLHEQEIDLVSIATPTSTHYPIALDFIKAKKHLLVEKPITLKVAEAQNLIREANNHQVTLTVGHIERFNPAVKKLKLMITKGQLGEVKSLLFQRVGLIPHQIKHANVVVDIGIHDIDIANYLLDSSPLNIAAFGGKALINYQEDHADILLRYKSATAHIQINWITPLKIRRLMIAGTQGYAELDYINQQLDFYQHHYTQEYTDFGEFVIKFDRKTQKQPISITKQEPLQEQLTSFIKSIQAKRPPEVTGQDGLLALKTALEISQLIKNSSS
jgi:UDP-N-acetylglucosamine 3-dehydrogenase